MNAMDCTDIKAHLSALIDDVLDETRRHQAERHLADCARCRRTVDDAEMIEALIAADVASREPVQDPMAGFEAAVLRRTVGSDGSRSWTSWLGWVAAAASLLLAVTLWIVSGQSATMRSPRDGSWQDRGEIALTENTSPIPLGAPADAQPSVASLGPTVSLVGRTRRGIELVNAPADAATIDMTMFLLGQLAHADLSSFEDVERIRAAITYEGLPHKLDVELAQALPSRWELIRSAKWILDRIAAGPITMADVRQMKRDLASDGLIDRLADLQGTMGTRFSL